MTTTTTPATRHYVCPCGDTARIQLEAERNALVDAMRGIVDRLTSAVRDGDSTRVVRALEIARASLPLPPSPAAGGAK